MFRAHWGQPSTQLRSPNVGLLLGHCLRRWSNITKHWANVSSVLGVTSSNKKWNELGFRPPLCTYRLNWARRTSWGWWDDWDETVLQTQDSKFEPWRSEAEHVTSRSQRLPTILTFTRGWGRNIFVSFKPPRPGTEPRTLAWKAAVLTTALGPPPYIVKQGWANGWPLSQNPKQHLNNTGLYQPRKSIHRSRVIKCWANV